MGGEQSLEDIIVLIVVGIGRVGEGRNAVGNEQSEYVLVTLANIVYTADSDVYLELLSREGGVRGCESQYVDQTVRSP